MGVLKLATQLKQKIFLEVYCAKECTNENNVICRIFRHREFKQSQKAASTNSQGSFTFEPCRGVIVKDYRTKGRCFMGCMKKQTPIQVCVQITCTLQRTSNIA